ncbi:MAG TPA: VPLPA-CTERM-specific exosortase XrtD [Blastocatellia bacterium]|nr:VPLPA-CTERM-specific exosortase XrtD [Blastocatellia bacterium]
MAILLALAWLAVYHDVLRRLVDDWRVDENYSHGFLIPLISAYAIWAKREKLLALPTNPRWLAGGALMALAALLLLAGVMGAELYITRLSLVLSLVALTVYFGGFAWLRQFWFPIGLLLFALPVPNIVFNQIALPLQLIASDYATRAIRLFGIPALREGNVIELAQMKLQVVEACSGIRSLMTLAALAVVYAYFAETRWWRRIVLVVAVVPIAVLANAARVAGTGVLAHHYGVKAAEGFLHSFSGLAIFLVAVGLLLALAQTLNLLERLFSSTKPHEEHTKKVQRDSVALPEPSSRFAGKRSGYWAMLFCLLLMVGSVTYLSRAGEGEHAPPRTALAEFPVELDSWRQVEVQTLDDRTARELAADDYLSRTYSNGQAYAYLFIAFHHSQRHRQTFHSPQNCIPGAGWTMGNYRRHALRENAEANEYLIGKDDVQMLALYWYQGRGKLIASEYRARLDTIKDAMWLGRTDGALVRVIVPMGKGAGAEELARKAALDFSQKLLPILPSFIPN